jgi:hypothetical protein
MLIPNFSVVNLVRKDAFRNDGDAMAVSGIDPSLAHVKAGLTAKRRAKVNARTAQLMKERRDALNNITEITEDHDF